MDENHQNEKPRIEIYVYNLFISLDIKVFWILDNFVAIRSMTAKKRCRSGATKTCPRVASFIG